MKVIVTGGAGFIGSHAAEAFTGAGHQVLVLDDLSSGKMENLPEGVESVEVSVVAAEIHAAVWRHRHR